MATPAVIYVLGFAIVFAVFTAVGPRVTGYGCLIIGVIQLLLTLGGYVPGYYPLVMIPVSVLLMIGGCGALLAIRNRPS